MIVNLLTGFDPCQKWLRVKLVLALHSDFLKKVTFGIFGRKPKGVRSLPLPDLYMMVEDIVSHASNSKAEDNS